jgi:hypothetical protein
VGIRYRKSINLPFGFKVNLSKSGVGVSWGRKGIRVTRTAKGKIRRTYSIPGTGISYVSEDDPLDKLKKRASDKAGAASQDNAKAGAEPKETDNDGAASQEPDKSDSASQEASGSGINVDDLEKVRYKLDFSLGKEKEAKE